MALSHLRCYQLAWVLQFSIQSRECHYGTNPREDFSSALMSTTASFVNLSRPLFPFLVPPYYHDQVTFHRHEYASSIGFRAQLRYVYRTRSPLRDSDRGPSKPCRCAIGPFRCKWISRHRTPSPQDAQRPSAAPAAAAKSPNSCAFVLPTPNAPISTTCAAASASPAPAFTSRPAKPATKSACASSSSCPTRKIPARATANIWPKSFARILCPTASPESASSSSSKPVRSTPTHLSRRRPAAKSSLNRKPTFRPRFLRQKRKGVPAEPKRLPFVFGGGGKSRILR